MANFIVFIRSLFTWLFRLKRYSMGRPTTLRPKSGGQIILMNVSSEVKEKVKALMEGDVISQVSTEPAEEAPAVSKELTHLALGVCKVGDDWALASIKYNPVSQASEVESVEIVGPSKAFAENEFKIDAIRRGVI